MESKTLVMYMKKKTVALFNDFRYKTIAQFWYLKIQPQTVDFSTRLWGINYSLWGFFLFPAFNCWPVISFAKMLLVREIYFSLIYLLCEYYAGWLSWIAKTFAHYVCSTNSLSIQLFPRVCAFHFHSRTNRTNGDRLFWNGATPTERNSPSHYIFVFFSLTCLRS